MVRNRKETDYNEDRKELEEQERRMVKTGIESRLIGTVTACKLCKPSVWDTKFKIVILFFRVKRFGFLMSSQSLSNLSRYFAFHACAYFTTYFPYLVLSLPYDLNRRPLKTITAATAEVAMVCSYGIRITNAITNVIAAAIAAMGIHTLTALEDLSSAGCMIDY